MKKKKEVSLDETKKTREDKNNIIMVRRRSDLPPEIIEVILLKLPAKSLLRFKSVSKSWNTIISHPLFVQNHHHNNSQSHNNLFLREIWSETSLGLSLIKLEHGKLQPIKELEFPLVHQSGNHLRCYCEYGAVLLIASDWHERCILWNPSTQTTKTIPYSICAMCCGLCYDPVTDDFKVVFLCFDFYIVYSSKNESCSDRKELPHAIARMQLAENVSGVSTTGAIYWRLWDSERCEVLMCYGARDDKFRILQNPKDVEDDTGGFLVDSEGHLCLYCYTYYPETIRMWRKEKGVDENSWKELMTIHDINMNVGMSICSSRLLCFLGNKIVVHYCDGKLLVYNPLHKTFEELEEKLFGIKSLVPYRDTLFLT